MPLVIIRFLGLLRDKVGRDALPLKSGETVGDLINELVRELPQVKELIEGGLVTVLVNGRAIEWLNGLKTKLRDGDEVVLMPPAGGG